MFLAQTPDLLDDDPPVRYVANMDGTMLKMFHDSSASEYPLKHFDSIDDANLSFEYLDMKAGDCHFPSSVPRIDLGSSQSVQLGLIMGKRHLHMSDPRLLLKQIPNDRLAVNVRVLIKDHANTIPFWPYHSYNHACHQRLKHKAFAKPIPNGIVARIPVDRYEMLNLAWNAKWD